MQNKSGVHCLQGHGLPRLIPFLGVPVQVFLNEISTSVSGLCKADGPPQCDGHDLNPESPKGMCGGGRWSLQFSSLTMEVRHLPSHSLLYSD